MDDSFFQNSLPQYYRAILKQFRKVTHAFVSFNLLFATLLIAQLVSLPFLFNTSFFIFSLAALFLTCFSYFILLFYYQARKPEELEQLKIDFIQSCRQMLPIPQGEAEHHLSIAEALSKLSSYLQDFEANFYEAPKWIAPLVSRFSKYCYREDVFKMKVQLLQAAIDEHMLQIQSTPTDLEVHASLASAYVTLAQVYKAPGFEEKHAQITRLAIEEFSILGHYAPNDPWVHEQLATNYHHLGMQEKELQEVETLLKLRMKDKEILYRLGSLYFKQGMNAKGLQIYEELKKANFQKASDLIGSYGKL